MKNILKNSILTIGLSVLITIPAMAAADCYVDYKAKQTASSLKLHYGVMELNGDVCSNNGKAKNVVSKRLAKGGWKLLTILSRFDESGLSKRQTNAGAYFLRY
jgi:hypothetical protein